MAPITRPRRSPRTSITSSSRLSMKKSSSKAVEKKRQETTEAILNASTTSSMTTKAGNALNATALVNGGIGFVKADAHAIIDNVDRNTQVKRRAPWSSQPNRHHTKHSLEAVLSELLEQGIHGGHWNPVNDKQFVITAGSKFALAAGRSSWQSLDKILKNMGLLKLSVDIRHRQDQSGPDRAIRVFEYCGPSHLGYSFQRGEVTLLPRRAGSLEGDPTGTIRWRDPITKILTEPLPLPRQAGQRKDPESGPAPSSVLSEDMRLRAVDFNASIGRMAVVRSPSPRVTTENSVTVAFNPVAPAINSAAAAAAAAADDDDDDETPVVEVKEEEQAGDGAPMEALLEEMYDGDSNELLKDLDLLSNDKDHGFFAQRAISELEAGIWGSESSHGHENEFAQSMESPTSAASWSSHYSPSPVPSFVEGEVNHPSAEYDNKMMTGMVKMNGGLDRADSLKVMIDAAFSHLFASGGN